jgi:uroporphyrinogen decarboxylase
MAETGVTGMSLDSKQIGVKLEETAKKVPDNILLIGNISPVDVMMNGTPEDVKKEVSELLDLMKPYPNFILSTGCNLPQETPVENIQMFMKVGREHKI